MSARSADALARERTPAESSTAMDPRWDYTLLAPDYDQRPGYDSALVESILDRLQLAPTRCAIDVGAGTGALTRLLCRSGAEVIACEPNAAMRAIGSRHAACSAARWIGARGEALPLADGVVDLVAFGSSFNVLPAHAALQEAHRVLGDSGYWLALWNHRDLEDPLQREVEHCIRSALPDFDPGSRRQDPRPELQRFGGFMNPQAEQQRFDVNIASDDWLSAWRAHATLRHQAGPVFEAILQSIGKLVAGQSTLRVPYLTRAYWAQRA